MENNQNLQLSFKYFNQVNINKVICLDCNSPIKTIDWRHIKETFNNNNNGTYMAFCKCCNAVLKLDCYTSSSYICLYNNKHNAYIQYSLSTKESIFILNNKTHYTYNFDPFNSKESFNRLLKILILS